MATQTINVRTKTVKKTTTIKKRDKKKSGSSQRGKNKRCPTCGKFRSP